MAKIKKPKIYTEDGLKFKTKPLLDFYKELRSLLDEESITSFTLPTIEEQKEKSKYGAKKCEVDGYVFDSIMEAKYYIHLKKEKHEGNIKEVELQPKFVLQEGFRKDGKAIRAIHYISDFLVTYNDESKIVFDVKGRETTDFLIKKKMFDYKYRELKLVCVQYRAREKKWMDLEDIKKIRRENKKSKGVKAK